MGPQIHGQSRMTGPHGCGIMNTQAGGVPAVFFPAFQNTF